MATPFKATALSGGGVASGSFTADAASTKTISDSDVATTSIITLTPTNAAAGLLVRSKSVWVDTIGSGSFVFNCSATAAGAPAGTETFAYVAQRES